MWAARRGAAGLAAGARPLCGMSGSVQARFGGCGPATLQAWPKGSVDTMRQASKCRRMAPVWTRARQAGLSSVSEVRSATNDVYFAWHPSKEVGLSPGLSQSPPPPHDSEAAELAAFCARVQISFNDEQTLLLAVSPQSEGDGGANQDRLAVLGRTVAAAALTEYLYVRFPKLPAEQMSVVAGEMMKQEIFLRAANNVGVLHLVRKDENIRKVLYKPSTHKLLADTFSAIIGAIFVDQGTLSAHNFALNMLAPVLEHVGVVNLAKLGNPKKTLADLLTEEGFESATYETVAQSGGRRADAVYQVEVYSGDKLLGEGAGFTLAMAEAEAAKGVLLDQYSTEVSSVVLPSSWGDFAVADAEDYIAKLFPESDSDPDEGE